MKKTLVALLVSGALVFALAACGKKAEEPAPAPAPTEQAPSPAPAAPGAPMGGATTAH